MLLAVFDILGPVGSALASAPPPLPPSPAVERWLFERPVATGLALVGFALATFVVFNRRGEGKRGLVIASVLLALGVGAATTGILVETTRERLSRLSKELVDSIAAGEADRAAELLAPDVVVAIGSTPIPGGGFARRALETFRDNVRVTEHIVSDRSATVGAQPTSGASQFFVRASTDVGFATAWIRLNWRKEQSGGWQVYLIEVLRVNGQTPEGAGAAQFFNR